jgi:hypothetical protein
MENWSQTRGDDAGLGLADKTSTFRRRKTLKPEQCCMYKVDRSRQDPALVAWLIIWTLCNYSTWLVFIDWSLEDGIHYENPSNRIQSIAQEQIAESGRHLAKYEFICKPNQIICWFGMIVTRTHYNTLDISWTTLSYWSKSLPWRLMLGGVEFVDFAKFFFLDTYLTYRYFVIKRKKRTNL